MWNESDNRAIRVLNGHAQHQAWSDFRSKPEINEPDFAARRDLHS